MNGLALRIGRGGVGKTKNSIGYAPVPISASLMDNTGENNTEVQEFINSASTDDQLVILKKILETGQAHIDDVVIKFLVVTFFQAEAKHPIKCFISRHITKNKHLQQPFTDALALCITAYISTVPSNYKQYVDVVSKVAICLENFNAGVAAVRNVEMVLAEYLRDCLQCCVKIIRENKTLSPTEKNEIFNLAHLSLRLLLHIVQKANTDNISKLTLMFEVIRLFIQELMFDEDVPMDTKSLCGILYLTMHVMENGAESWIDVLNPNIFNSALNNLLKLEAGRLSLHSAIATVVSVDHLFTQTVDGGPAIVTLTKKILDIGERSSSESTFILSVARTLLQISKLLDKIPDRTTGVILVDCLLMFAWSHLEHYMDSVRHLTGQMLGCVVKYCVKLDREGDSTALNKLTTALKSLDRSRKSFYLSVTWLVNELGARKVLQLCVDIRDVIQALHSQPIHSTASTALETLLEKYSSECTTEELNSVWVQPILLHVQQNVLDSSILNVMESLLVKAFRLHPNVVKYILPHIKEASSPTQTRDLKCILMLLRVARKSNVTDSLAEHTSGDEWKGVIRYNVLEQAAVDAVDETRILSLSLIVESPKSTEYFTEGDLRFILYYLKYNINAQAPNFRQLTLSLMKKFIKRLEDSYKVIKRQKEPNGVNNKVDYYLRFMEQLRRQCFNSLIPGANYSRRFVTLQILAWCEQITLEGYERSWESDFVEKLLLHLEDSYENNKGFALNVLASCPVQLLKSKKYSFSLEIEDIFLQASSLKPTDCVSAAYKLDLVRTRLPEYILENEECAAADPVNFTLLSKLLAAVQSELSICKDSVVVAAGRAPMYGLTQCMGHVLLHVDPIAISSDARWTSLIADMITTCVAVNAAVACVVNNSSPEGHLPMDMSVQITDHGNTGNVTLADGRQVTAQMVLLCAWRSVKEVSLLLGSICSRLTITGECSGPATLSVSQVSLMGQHFTSLLAETKHRGAFEQAYVGFTHLLARLWRCRSPSLHEMPRNWLAELMLAIASADRKGQLCATRRSAGLPFMIQALVTTELQVEGNPKCFHSCMSTLLQLTDSSCEESRTHALNILRALFRNAALDESVAPYVGHGLMAALKGAAADPVNFTLLSKLLAAVQSELSICKDSVVVAAGRAPMYGLTQCMGHVLLHVDPIAISSDARWTSLIADMITTCVAVNAAVACVVNNSSPEGHLPMDMSVQITDHGNTGNVTLADGRQVTAQMVLLCAWRSVKEVSLLLGSICSRLTITGECSGPATLSVSQVSLMGQHFTSLLAETKHRGAFEQAYVGFTHLLARLWRCRSPSLHEMPRNWLAELMLAIASADRKGQLCATRRSAGLPFMIQALVTTELQVEGNPKCFHSCMSTLLQLTDSSCEESRTHALNILRALFRNAALDESVAPYVGHGLMAALKGFEGHTWAERNSSTLLFSALMVRVFGVQRSRDTDRLCVRNRMTGRIFFLRYPQIYNFMLHKLQEVSDNADGQVLRPSLYPVLLLLARLYPSSLEGTVSNLKLVAYIPHVLCCAKSSVLKTRQLAAKAIVPLISPEQYIPHIQSMFKLLHNANIKRNYCHGILLQLVRILDARPEELVVQEEDLQGCVEGTLWMLTQATGRNPCYLITDELVKVINLIVWRFPTLPQETISEICSYLHALIFDSEAPNISPGRDVCLSNAIYLYFILATKYNITDTNELVYKGLEHYSYEVVLSVLNYLLILHKDFKEEPCKFQEHLLTITDKSTLNKIRNENYIQLLCKVLKNKYLECQQKSLKILTLEGNTQKYIIQTKIDEEVTDKMIIEKLFYCLQNEQEKLTHIYLQSLLNYVTDRLKESSLCINMLLDVIRVIFKCSSSDTSEDTRSVVVGFIERNIHQLLELDMSKLSEADRFELGATLWATMITLLEDDENPIRQRISDALSPICGGISRISANACGDTLREYLKKKYGEEGVALFAVIALMDFNSVVLFTDDVSDECRVFDQNERYNIFLEETVWTNACADIIINHYKFNDPKLSVIDNPVYRGTFEKLCKDNIDVFKKMVAGEKLPRNDALNPKIELFVNRLCKAVN